MPKIVDHDERRAHIAESVTNIIIRDGFDRVTMREIAAEAGYAHGAMARYFPNKQSLLTAAFLQLYSRSNERISQSVAGFRGLEALERMCREILPFEGRGGPRHSRLVISFWDHAAQDDELRTIHRENNMRWRELFRRFLLEARDDGELADHVDIDTAVNEVASRNAGWQMIAALLPDIAGDDQLEQGLRALIDGLSTEPARVGAP